MRNINKKCAVTNEMIPLTYAVTTVDGDWVNEKIYRATCYHYKKGLVTTDECRQTVLDEQVLHRLLGSLVLAGRKQALLSNTKNPYNVILSKIQAKSINEYSKEAHCLDFIELIEVIHSSICELSEGTEEVLLNDVGGRIGMDLVNDLKKELRKGTDRKILKGVYLS